MCCDTLDSLVASVIRQRMHSLSLDDDIDALAFMLRGHRRTGFPTLQQIREEVKTLLFAGALPSLTDAVPFTCPGPHVGLLI